MVDDVEAGALSETIRHLAARWASADRRILRHVFPLLVEGQPVPVERIAKAAGCEPATADMALDHGRAERDSKGRIVELSGLTLLPTMHRLEIDGVALFGCCALMVHQAPMLVGRPIIVESIDPETRGIIGLSIGAEGVRRISSPGVVSAFVATEASGVQRDVRGNFCGHVRFFATSDSARRFVERDPRRYVMPIEELHRAACVLYRKVWSAAASGSSPGVRI